MTADLNHLTQRLIATEAGAVPWLWQPLLALLAQGNPVSVEDLSAATGRSVADVRQGLEGMPDTEYDADGRILGHGLTLIPTAHRFEVAGRPMYTWCALDTLIFPTLLERAASVESGSPTSGEPIRVTIDPVAGVTSVEPATAVVSLVNPDQITSIRSSFCNQVNYFTSEEDAAGWLAEHPRAEVVPVAVAYRIGTDLTTGFLNQFQANAAVADDGHCRC